MATNRTQTAALRAVWATVVGSTRPIWDYSHSTDVVARVIEVISEESLYSFEKERILDPLGMADTSFYVTDKGNQARVERSLVRGRRLVQRSPRGQKWESGGGGMVSTAADYARLLQMLLNGGTLDGKRILGARTVAYTTDGVPQTCRPAILEKIEFAVAALHARHWYQNVVV